MLRRFEVVKTNDAAQALNHTIQVQPFGVLLNIQLHSVCGFSWRPFAKTPPASHDAFSGGALRAASGKHALTSATATAKTFDESRDRRARRKARARQCLGTKKADVPALEALDRYAQLSTHEQHHLLRPQFSMAGIGLVELSPEHIVSTTLYNEQFPGPLIRLKEGKRVVVDLHNDTDTPELVHWHGQLIPSEVDGAAEEGTPYIPPHGMRRIAYVPKPGRSDAWRLSGSRIRFYR
jgi:hypothetical protein